MKRKTAPLQLGFDILEDRVTPAGAVRASVVDGVLLIQGDNDGNRLTIDSPRLGAIRIVGESFTYINGDTAPVVFSNVSRNIEVRLAGSNDRIVVHGLQTPRGLRIHTGTGSDTLLIDNSIVRQDLDLNSADDNDIINVVGSVVRQRTRIGTELGDDVVSVESSRFGGAFSVRTGAGNDTIYHANSAFKEATFDTGPGDDSVTREALGALFDFRQGARGWQAGFSDYRDEGELLGPQSTEEFFELEAGMRELPEELGPGTGFFISGSNHSDDLFMFLKRRLGPENGIKPNQTYALRLGIVLGSNVPTGCAGIGGSPGESVFLKGGSAAREPARDPETGGLNVDKGNQATGGPAASVISGIGNGIPCDEAFENADEETGPPWVSLHRPHIHDFLVRSNANGELWLLVGTDSGFEGKTSLYYQRIEFKLIPVGVGIDPDKAAPPRGNDFARMVAPIALARP